MPQHEQPNNYEDLARQIREAGNATGEKSPHSGMESVPEDVRETPLRDFDNTPLERAVEEGKVDPDNLPDHLGEVEPHQDDEITIAKHVAKKTAEAVPATKKSRRGIAAIAGTALAAVVGGGLMLGLNHGGSESDHRTTEPSAAASPNPGKSEVTKAPEAKLITSPLDASVDSSIVPLTDNQLSVLEYKNWPNNVERSLIANIDPSAVDNFILPGAMDNLVNRMPQWDGLYGVYQKYNTRGLLEAMGNRNMMNTIYNRDFAGMAGQYGEPQNFASPDTANLIGAAPVVKISDIEKASKDADFAPIWKKIYPDNRDYQKILLGELKAGNTDPALVDRLVTIAMLGNETQGNLDSPMDSQTRDEIESTYRDGLTNLYNEYLKDPKKAESDYNANQPGKVTTESVNVYDAVRQLPGEDVRAGTDATSTVSDFVVFRTYTVEGSPQGIDDGQYGEVSVISFVAAPTKEGKGQYAMPILLDRTTTKFDTTQQ